MKQKDRKGFKNVVLLGFVVLIVICAGNFTPYLGCVLCG